MLVSSVPLTRMLLGAWQQIWNDTTKSHGKKLIDWGGVLSHVTLRKLIWVKTLLTHIQLLSSYFVTQCTYDKVSAAFGAASISVRILPDNSSGFLEWSDRLFAKKITRWTRRAGPVLVPGWKSENLWISINWSDVWLCQHGPRPPSLTTHYHPEKKNRSNRSIDRLNY